MTLPDETLMAFADGTLPAEAAARVAAAVAADPALAERVAELRAGGAAARGAFAHVLAEPVPERLLAALRPRAPATAPWPGAAAAAARRPPRWRGGLAIAASLLLGLVGGWSLRGGDPGPGRIGPDLAATLETQPSGLPGAPALLATHALADGGTCRVFTLEEGEGSLTGLACRGAGGPWRLQALVARRGAAQGFAPAGAEDPVLADMLERLGAGPALTEAEERAAIARAWRQPR